jgi:1-acyl-sn-glycerol-3-phosphate acyltransferase
VAEKVEFQTYPMDAKWRLPFRYAWGVAATALSLLFTALLAPVAFVAARARRVNVLAWLGRFWAQGLIKICSVKVEVSGVENIANLKSGVLFSNHQSFFDVFAMLAYMPPDTRFVAKKELLKVPAFGYALERSDHVVIDRDGGGRQIRHAVEILRSGKNLGIFPEGHRHTDGQVHEFEEGAAWLAILSQRPAVPVAIVGGATVLPPSSLFVCPGRTMRIAIGKPIPTAGMRNGDRAKLTDRIHSDVSDLYINAARSSQP